jgi:hypothetical protein
MEVEVTKKWTKLRASLNELARKFYTDERYSVPKGHDFQNSSHPQERACFGKAMIAYEHFGSRRRLFWREEVAEWKGQP